MEHRNEWKYICNDAQLEVIKWRLLPIMELDSHLDEHHLYNIRSIYFDDYFDTFVYENEAGFDNRMKVRIRIYNHSSNLIKLELKYKINGYTKKEACSISKELCLKIMNGEPISFEETNNNPILNLFYVYTKDRLLKPKVIVEYDRTVFINKTGNVRVTFDKNIRCSRHIDRFFEDNLYATPVLEGNQHVLEVKFDELLPDYIASALDVGHLRQTSFSKYYLSRLRLGVD